MVDEPTIPTDDAAAAPEEEEVGSRTVPEPAPLAAVAERFPQVAWELFSPPAGPDQHVAHVERTDLVAFVAALRDVGFETFIDLCAVDYLGRRPRFEVVVTLLDMRDRLRVRLRVPVPGTDPVVPSITSIYAGANAYEREAWDLFGIDFEGHPELTRILLPDDWEGHPLRKDAGVGSVPVQFKGAHRAS